MIFTTDIDGVQTRVSPEEIEQYREVLIELRNAALDATDFDRAVVLSHTIAFLHSVKQHAE
jgi:hypothetical protein